MCGITRCVRKAGRGRSIGLNCKPCRRGWGGAGLKSKFFASVESGHAVPMMLELAFAIGLAVHCLRERSMT